MSRNGTNVGSVSINLNLNSSGFLNGLNGLQGNLGGLSSGFAKLGGVIAAAFSVEVIAKFGKSCADAFSKAEQGAMKLYATLSGQGINFDSADSFITKFVDDGLVELNKAQEAYANLAQMGMNTEQIEQMMQVMKDSAAVGRQGNYTIGEAMATATEGMKQGLSNKTDNVGITTNLSQMEKEYKKLLGITGDLTQEQRNQAYVNGFLKEGAKYTGVASKMTQTYTGSISALSTQFNNLKVNIGSILSHVIQPIVQGLTLIVSKLNEVAKAWANTLNNMFHTKTAKDFFTDTSESVAGGTEAIGESASSAAKKITRAVAPFDKLNKIANTAANSGGSGGTSSTTATAGPLPDGEAEKENENINRLKEKIEEIKNAWTTGWNNGFKADFGKLKENIGRIGEAVKNIFTDENVQGAMNGLAMKLVETAGTVAGTVTSVGVSLGTWITGGIARALEENSEGIKNWIVDMCGEAELFLDRIGNFASAISDIFTVFESDEAEVMLSNLLSLLGEIWGTVEKISLMWVSDVFNFFTEPIIKNVEKIKETLINMFDGLNGQIENIKLVVHSICENAVKLYEEHLRPLFQAITDNFTEWFGIILDGWNQYIYPVFKNLQEKFKEVIENYIIPFIDKLSEKLGVFIDALKVFYEKILGPLVSWLLQNLIPVLGTIFKVVGDIAVVLTKTLFAALNFILDPIEGVKNAFSVLIDIGGDVLTCFFDLGEGVVGIFNGIVDTIKGAINGVIGIINNMIDGINNLNIDIPNPFGEDKHIGFNIPHIPQLANGGYVGPNNPQLAVIGDNRQYGEVIANDKQLSDLGNTIINGVVGAIGSVTGGTQPIYLTVQMGEDDITDIVASSVNKYQKRTGKRIF